MSIAENNQYAALGNVPPFGNITPANVLDGSAQVVATQAATTFLTIPAGRTWVGQVTLSCACTAAAAVAAGAEATGIVTVAGAGAAPPAGVVLKCRALAGANTAASVTGTQGENSASTPLVVIAPAGNAVTLQLATTNSGSTTEVDVTAIGALQ